MAGRTLVRLTVVVNPAATRVGADLRAAVVEALAADHEVTVAETAGPGGATACAAQAAAEGADVVVSLGGDGTANETANALAGTATALAALPGGSTNVFPRTIGFPNDTSAATTVLRSALAAGSRRRIGVGRAGDRRFLFHAGIGFDARVIELVERHSWAKRSVGPLAFAGAAGAVWLGTGDHPTFTVEVCTTDAAGTPEAGIERIEGRFAICLKTNPYTYLGPRPLTVAPEAGLGRPLALVVLRDLGMATMAPALCSALQDGRRLRELPGVAVRTGLERVSVTANEPVGHQVDGEFLGLTADLELRHEPNCLDLVVPPASG